jgi:hypothetical protein
MTKKIESNIEFKVKQNWLMGMARDENAADCGISTDSVSNIIKTFLDSLAGYDVESIREFVVHLRKENLTVKECALGYRYKNILDNLGISDDENLQIFLKDAYRLCNQLDVNKAVMQDCLLEMIRIAKEEVPPSQLNVYIQRQIQKKALLEDKVKNLTEDIQNLEKEKSDAEEKYALVKDKIGISSAKLDWYVNIKDGLEKEGIPIDDISFLATTIKKIKKYSDKDIFEILQKINDLEGLDKEIESNKRIRDTIKIDIQTILKIDSEYSDFLSSKTILLDCLDELKKLGFGLPDLKKIRDVLIEISSENDRNPLEIKERFFESLSSYEKNIALENEKKRLEYLISDLNEEIQNKRLILLSQGSTGIILRNLLDRGLNENDIIRVKKFVDTIEKYNTVLNNLLLDLLVFDMAFFKSQQMIKENKECIIPTTAATTNQIIGKDLDPFFNGNKNTIINPSFF